MPLIGQQPKPGDLIEVLGARIQHWAVYVGDGYVVHLTSEEPSWFRYIGLSAGPGKQAVVKKQTLEEAAKGYNYRVNNKYDNDAAPRPAAEIVKAALKEVGKKKKYHILYDNCEHFATEMRYGHRFCDQAGTPGTKVGVGVGVGLATGLLAFVGGMTGGAALIAGAAIGTAASVVYSKVRNTK